MDRKENLLILFREDERPVVEPFVNEILDIEAKLAEVKQHEFLKIRGTKQKITAAGRLYTALLAQYSSAMKTLYALARKKGGNAPKSPLREYLETR